MAREKKARVKSDQKSGLLLQIYKRIIYMNFYTGVFEDYFYAEK